MAIRDIVQAAAGVGGGDKLYVEDVFATDLYVGNGSANHDHPVGIDMTEGGLTWIKNKISLTNHQLLDSEYGIRFNTDLASSHAGVWIPNYFEFTSTGWTGKTSLNHINQSTYPYVNWNFRKTEKFFDVLKWTGNNTNNRQILHSLGSRPGMVVVKNISDAADWYVWHRSLAPSGGSAANLRLNTTDAVQYSDYYVEDSTSSEYIQLGLAGGLNENNKQYVAYLFAHNAGGFGLTGTDNVISCGSYTGTGVVGNEVTLGFEPQWLLVKSSSLSENWWLVDVMRGMPVENYTGAKGLRPNTSNTEATPFGLYPTATGFVLADGGGAINQNNATYIYIAIRRGPMKTPESGTEVFDTVFRNATSGLPQWNSGFVTDFSIAMDRDGSGNIDTVDRLRGKKRLLTYDTAAETNGSPNTLWDYMTGYGATTGSSYDRQLAYMFRRAPGFFDEVCYTGTGVAHTEAHNLGVVPEMMIVKNRNVSINWAVYNESFGATKYLILNSDGVGFTNSALWNDTAPTSSVFTVGTSNPVNASGNSIVAYLFATCPGVSKVGSYTGTGTTLQIDCGFSAGARFILIKRTDSTGDWYVWDSARGIVSGNDPYLLLNSTAAEVTSTDYIDPLASGFTVTSNASSTVNVNTGTYIFLAIA